MEILFELLWFLVELLLEGLLQAAAEGLFEGLGKVFSKSVSGSLFKFLDNRVYHLGIGSLAGWMSLFLFPNHFIHLQHIRAANLVLTPIVVAWGVTKILEWSKGLPAEGWHSNRFWNTYCFALTMALVRWFFCN